MDTDQDTTREQRPSSSSEQRRARRSRPQLRSEPASSWLDPTDVADHEAYERARREQALERPPHY